ncbi:efflux transporter outer membrane subunit [Nitrospirillum pindoramense]|uniref:Multidrug efflux system outer membrane protein n=1 Tax=Nitrospirillum amazonense TaxID=28077 RepID=A0A560HCI6_9PROT|nr:efflux transporter outer membrane subunit [Nitrospirillum amazonense]TWB43439.1 multidrug efflux system outer membrane protein [Nitrospirillum amazonense]
MTVFSIPKRIAAFTALLLTTASLGACSLAPDYTRPQSPVPNAWPTGQAYEPADAPGKPSPLQGPDSWKAVFRGPRLQALIAKSLENNRDLRVALLNIEVARANYRVQDAATLPTLNAGGSTTRARTPISALGAQGASAGASGSGTKGITYNSSQAQVSVTSYELDLFGRVHSLSQQALEQYLSTAEATATTRLSLIAEVANAYLTLVSDRQLLALTQDTLRTQEETYNRNKRMFDRGSSSALDLAQSQTSVDTARANLEQYTRQVAQDRNALELLVGAPLTDAEIEGASLDDQDVLGDLPAGLPSDLVLRRPDVREAEHTLKAANANIGAARAAFFPQITLTGSYGTASAGLTDLFAPGSSAWSFGPSISVPIFDNGKNQANLDSAKATRDIDVANYEKAVQTAFREVADALAARGTLDRQLTAQTSLVKSSQLTYDLSNKRYERGVDSFLTLLDAQRSLYSAQQNRISVQLSLLENRVTLFKVLGGSETAPTVEAAAN